jgi:hypothetical protein
MKNQKQVKWQFIQIKFMVNKQKTKQLNVRVVCVRISWRRLSAGFGNFQQDFRDFFFLVERFPQLVQIQDVTDNVQHGIQIHVQLSKPLLRRFFVEENAGNVNRT